MKTTYLYRSGTRDRRFPSLRLLLAGAVLLGAGGCRVGPEYKRPELSGMLQSEWRTPLGKEGARTMEAQGSGLAWWEQFNDPALSRLVQRSLQGNYALAEVRERIVEARARRGIVNAGRIPQVNAAADYTRGETGTKAVSLQGPPPGTKADIYTFGAMAGWEVDLWGRVAHEVDAADAEIEQSREAWRDAAVSLASEVTLTYIELRTLQQRLEVLDRNIQLVEHTLSLVKKRFEAGTGTKLDMAQTRRMTLQIRSRRPELLRLINAAENRLAVLTGRPPQDGIVEEGGVPEVPTLLGMGVPAELIVQRADVRQAERAYAVAVARIGAAEAERFPRLSLAGSFVLSADRGGRLFDREAKLVSFGPSLSFPFFSGGRISSNIRVRRSQADQACLFLRQTLLVAVREVEDSAAGIVRTQERVRDLEKAAADARDSVKLAEELYQNGVRSLLQVLDVQRELVAVEDDLLVARQEALANVVSLYRSLGGGWGKLEPYSFGGDDTESDGEVPSDKDSENTTEATKP